MFIGLCENLLNLLNDTFVIWHMLLWFRLIQDYFFAFSALTTIVVIETCFKYDWKSLSFHIVFFWKSKIFSFMKYCAQTNVLLRQQNFSTEL